MKIQFDKLEYDFQWMEFAATDEFKPMRRRYVTSILRGPQFAAIDMPTPVITKRTMGKWTLGNALGIGIQGRVFFGSDRSGDIAAVKVIERTSRNCYKVDEEIRIMQKVTDLAVESDEGDRILRVADVIYSGAKEFSSQTVFDNVTIILQPMTPLTFADLLGNQSKGYDASKN